ERAIADLVHLARDGARLVPAADEVVERPHENTVRGADGAGRFDARLTQGAEHAFSGVFDDRCVAHAIKNETKKSHRNTPAALTTTAALTERPTPGAPPVVASP